MSTERWAFGTVTAIGWVATFADCFPFMPAFNREWMYRQIGEQDVRSLDVVVML